MLKKIILLCLVLSFIAGLSLFFSCNKSSKFSVGESVAAKWTDDNYYLAVIKKAKGSNYDVDYADGDKGTVAEKDLMKIPATVDLKAGDKVFAVWTTARFYTGVVEEVKANSAQIKWDDGSAASDVSFGKIIKL